MFFFFVTKMTGATLEDPFSVTPGHFVGHTMKILHFLLHSFVGPTGGFLIRKPCQVEVQEKYFWTLFSKYRKI